MTDMAYQLSHALRLRKQLLGRVETVPQEEAGLLKEIFHPQPTCSECRQWVKEDKMLHNIATQILAGPLACL